jgi:hypothetical protein
MQLVFWACRDCPKLTKKESGIGAGEKGSQYSRFVTAESFGQRRRLSLDFSSPLGLSLTGTAGHILPACILQVLNPRPLYRQVKFVELALAHNQVMPQRDYLR